MEFIFFRGYLGVIDWKVLELSGSRRGRVFFILLFLVFIVVLVGRKGFLFFRGVKRFREWR